MKNQRRMDIPYITEPIVFEILSLVPAQDLLRYRTVCKRWRSFIDDPNFIDLQKSKASRSIIGTAKYPSFISQPPDGGEVFILNKRQGRLVGSSTCGLICIETRKNNDQVRNPVTGKSYHLPPLKSNSYSMHMRVYPNPQSRQFTVAAACQYTPSTPFQTFYWALFIIGVDSDWRCWEYSLGTDGVVGELIWWAVVLCENALICLTKFGDNQSKLIEILKLDPYSGGPTVLTPPFYIPDNTISSLRAHKWDGKFSISSVDENCICWWILEDEENNAWRYEEVAAPSMKDLLIYFVQEGNMWFRTKSRRSDLFSLDLLSNKVERINCSVTQIYDFEPYTSTLEVVDGMI